MTRGNSLPRDRTHSHVRGKEKNVPFRPGVLAEPAGVSAGDIWQQKPGKGAEQEESVGFVDPVLTLDWV